MGSASLDLLDLISNNSGSRYILPDVKRITDVRRFVAESTQFNGDISKIMEHIAKEEKECEDIVKLLEKDVQIKMDAMKQVKKDILTLQRELEMPNAKGGFQKTYKITIKLKDEKELSEHELPEALSHFNLKATSLYSNIMSLDSDIDYVNYLLGIIKANKQNVMDWEELNKSKLLKLKLASELK